MVLSKRAGDLIVKQALDMLRLIGKAAFLLGEHAQAALSYKKATELNSEAQPAWKGLVELYTSTSDAENLTDALEHLVRQRFSPSRIQAKYHGSNAASM